MLFLLGTVLILSGVAGLIMGFARKLRTDGYGGVLPGHESEAREAGFPAIDQDYGTQPVQRERRSARGMLLGSVAAVLVGGAVVLAGLARDGATVGAAATSPGMPTTTSQQPVAAP